MSQSVIEFCKTILLRFIHPESSLLDSIRSIRKQLSIYIFSANRQLKWASNSYPAWIKLHEQIKNNTSLENSPKLLVSFLIPKFEDLDQLSELVQSLKAQNYPNWELVVAANKNLSTKIVALDHRIKRADISEVNYFSLATRASGEFIICAQVNDKYSCQFLTRCIEKADQVPGTQIIYTDHDQINKNGNRTNPFFKPSTFSPEMLFSTNYLSCALLQRKMVLSVGECSPGETNPAANEWELILKCVALSPKMAHVADVLVHKGPDPKEEIQAQARAILEHSLKKRGLIQPRAVSTSDGWHVIWENEKPFVSIVIPSKNNFLVFKRNLISIIELTSYNNYEFIIVDNGSTDKDLFAFYKELQKKAKVKIVEYNEPFNYSRAINKGVAATNGKLLLLLNNDIQALDRYWLDELVRWALIPEIGIVGGKLLYPNGQIQHAGLVLGLEGFVNHLYLDAPQNYHGLIGSVNWYRNVSAVTGACQMMRRSVFDELGGYDENYSLVYSDIAICIKAAQKNYRILYTPFARLIHYHGLSRSRKDPIQDLALGYKHLLANFDGNDPFFSPNLTYTYIPRCQIEPETGEERLKRMREKQAIFEHWANKQKH